MIVALDRPDVLLSGDLALRRAIQDADRLARLPLAYTSPAFGRGRGFNKQPATTSNGRTRDNTRRGA